MVNQTQATLVWMETRLKNLENDRHVSNFQCAEQEIGTSSYLLKSQIQEKVAPNDLRGSRVFSKGVN